MFIRVQDNEVYHGDKYDYQIVDTVKKLSYTKKRKLLRICPKDDLKGFTHENKEDDIYPYSGIYVFTYNINKCHCSVIWTQRGQFRMYTYCNVIMCLSLHIIPSKAEFV
jgi:hypothetical protein